jgi:hypothetical protein
VNKGHTLDHIFILTLIEQGNDITQFRKDNLKIDVLYKGLIRKGLITTDEKITKLGVELLIFLTTRGKTSMIKKSTDSTEFDNWWASYPGTDTFIHKYKSFTGHRSLRVNKNDCRTAFNKILIEGEYTASQMIKALEIDVLQKKEASVKKNENKLSWMQNSLTYLNQRSFEPFIELIDTNIEMMDNSPKSIDI